MVDVELRALAVELRLGHVARIGEAGRVRHAFAEHRGNEGHGSAPDAYRTRGREALVTDRGLVDDWAPCFVQSF